MKLFLRIFATFCAVIVCAILIASFSFWLVQTTITKDRMTAARNHDAAIINTAVATFQSVGDNGLMMQMKSWDAELGRNRLFVIRGDDNRDILGRAVSLDTIKAAYRYHEKNPNAPLVRLRYNQLGEEYLFFIRDWDKPPVQHLPSPLLIPGLNASPVWHELLILSFIVIVGLLTAYILANNITRPISILTKAMNRLANGDLQTRVSHQLAERNDELAQLGQQFDKMAQKLQKLVEKERHLLHHVSHEMRSPLARMQAIVALIQVQPQNLAKHIERLESELSRMDGLVGELLTLSRLETTQVQMEKEVISPAALLQQLVEDSQEVASQHEHILKWCCSLPEHASIFGNMDYLYRAFDNILRNAFNYSPKGSTINLCISEYDRYHWGVSIADNGPGVSAEQLPHIFTAFYRADTGANKPGTGLGLAIVRHIIEQHGGKIFAENQATGGLIVYIILPKYEESAAKNKHDHETGKNKKAAKMARKKV